MQGTQKLFRRTLPFFASEDEKEAGEELDDLRHEDGSGVEKHVPWSAASVAHAQPHDRILQRQRG